MARQDNRMMTINIAELKGATTTPYNQAFVSLELVPPFEIFALLVMLRNHENMEPAFQIRE